jgi:hypothetical protein
MPRAELVERCWAYLVALVAMIAVFWPLRSGALDSFPLSTYPMFARQRGTPTLFAVVGTTADGKERSIPAALVASGEVLQTKVLIQRTVERGPAAIRELCVTTAEKLGRAPNGELTSVEIVRRRYDPIAYFESGPIPIERELLFRCPIPRKSRSAVLRKRAR